MRMIRLFTLVFALLVPSALIAGNGGEKDAASKWNIDKSHSNVTFSVRHFFTPVVGKFQDFTIDLNFDPENLATSNVSVEIPISSVDTGNERRDGHLNNQDFFESEKYPKMTFVSKSITKTGDNTYSMNGDLTIKDVTKNVDIPFTLLGIQPHPRNENAELAGFESTFKLNRLDYGVGTGNWVATTVVADEVTVSIFLEVNRTKE